MRIILIEPNRTLAKTYLQALEAEGHEVQVCLEAQQAISHSDKQRPDVIICELFLGEHNGVEFLYEFRSYPEWHDVPIIVLSMASPSELKDYQATFQRLNVSVCLYKPRTSLTQLNRAINRLQPVSAGL